mmetsp:Transcript_26431/g.77066  ORF Transcript_26431/g.77066 Transcript_26431/m.77066 type:complete len:385 (-) Transcript_26431:271-1425(-)
MINGLFRSPIDPAPLPPGSRRVEGTSNHVQCRRAHGGFVCGSRRLRLHASLAAAHHPVQAAECGLAQYRCAPGSPASASGRPGVQDQSRTRRQLEVVATQRLSPRRLRFDGRPPHRHRDQTFEPCPPRALRCACVWKGVRAQSVPPTLQPGPCEVTHQPWPPAHTPSLPESADRRLAQRVFPLRPRHQEGPQRRQVGRLFAASHRLNTGGDAQSSTDCTRCSSSLRQVDVAAPEDEGNDVGWGQARKIVGAALHRWRPCSSSSPTAVMMAFLARWILEVTSFEAAAMVLQAAARMGAARVEALPPLAPPRGSFYWVYQGGSHVEVSMPCTSVAGEGCEGCRLGRSTLRVMARWESRRQPAPRLPRHAGSRRTTGLKGPSRRNPL